MAFYKNKARQRFASRSKNNNSGHAVPVISMNWYIRDQNEDEDNEEIRIGIDYPAIEMTPRRRVSKTAYRF